MSSFSSYGSTTIDAEPMRIVTIGWSGQDAVIALNKVPVAMESFSGDGIETRGVTVEETGTSAAEWSVRLAYTPSGTPYLVVSGDSPSDPTVIAGYFDAPDWLAHPLADLAG